MRRVARKRASLALVAQVAAAFGASTAAAEESLDTAVTFAAPAGCPDGARFEEELSQRTGRVRLVRETERAAGRVTVTITEAKGRFTAKLVIREQGATTLRTIQGSQCASVVGASALTAAILLDPEGARTEASLPPPPAAAPALPVPAPAPTPPPPAPAPVPPALPLVPVARTPATPEGPRWKLAVGAGAGATTAIEGVDFPLSARADVRQGRGLLRPVFALHVNVIVGHEVARAAGSVRARGSSALLDASPHAVDLGSGFFFVPSLSAATWLLGVHATSAALDVPALRVLVAVGAGLRLERHFGLFMLAADVSGHAHLLRERFRIEPQGEVFRLPSVYVSGGISGAVTIP